MNKKIDLSNITIETDRLILRAFKETDLMDFNEYAKVDGVGQMAGWLPHKSILESKTILNNFISAKNVFAIVLKSNNKVIGSIGVEEYGNELYPELQYLTGLETGYALSKNYWNQGLMTEALKAVIRYFNDFIDFMMVSHFDWNVQSKRVIEKCGFKEYNRKYVKSCNSTNELCIDYIQYKNDMKLV